MNLFFCGTLVVVSSPWKLAANDAGNDAATPGKRADQFQLLKGEYEKIDHDFGTAHALAKTTADLNRVDARFSDQLRTLGKRFLRLAQENPLDSIAANALVWILSNDASSPAGQTAAELLLRHHANRKETLAAARSAIYEDACPATETLLQGLVHRTEPGDQQDVLRLSLATLLSKKADAAQSLKREGEQGTSRKHRDQAIVTYRMEAKPDQLTVEARRLLQQAIESLGGNPKKNEARLAFARKILFEFDHLAVGKVAPEIEGKDVNERTMRLSDHRGKVVVLKFWATWCGPCMAMVPHDRALMQRLTGKPFVLVGVNSDKDPAILRRLMDEKRIPWASWWDGGSMEGPIATKWNVAGLWGWPTIYVLDARGVIRYKGVRGQAMDDAVDYLLEETEAVRSKNSPAESRPGG